MKEILSRLASWTATVALSYGVIVACAVLAYSLFGGVAILPGFAVGLGICWLLATNGIIEKIDR